MEFPLLTEAVDFRGQTFKVRELNAAEFAAWATAMRKDPGLRLLEAARLGTVEPPVTIETLRSWPAALTIKLAERVLELSEADGPKAMPAEPAPSETSTG